MRKQLSVELFHCVHFMQSVSKVDVGKESSERATRFQRTLRVFLKKYIYVHLSLHKKEQNATNGMEKHE